MLNSSPKKNIVQVVSCQCNVIFSTGRTGIGNIRRFYENIFLTEKHNIILKTIVNKIILIKVFFVFL